GKFGGDLLVGNFGDGRIHAFKWSAEDGWEAHGVLKGIDHQPISIDGLWGIGFGNGARSGPTSSLFFAAGPDDEAHGLFGSITAPQGRRRSPPSEPGVDKRAVAVRAAARLPGR